MSGSLALEPDVTVILNCKKLLITSLASRHEKTFVKDCELLDMLGGNIWYQLMQIIVYLLFCSWIQLLVLVRAISSIGFKCFTDLEQWCSQTF